MARYLDSTPLEILKGRSCGGVPMKRHLVAFDFATRARPTLQQYSETRDEEAFIIPRAASMRDRISDSLSVLIPHSGWGAVVGGLAGLSAGVFVLTVLRIELDVAVSMLLVFTGSAAILGAWICTPIDTVSAPLRELQEEVNNGRTLLDPKLRNHSMISKAFGRKLTSGTA
jgi:hypothetical protein